MTTRTVRPVATCGTERWPLERVLFALAGTAIGDCAASLVLPTHDPRGTR